MEKSIEKHLIVRIGYYVARQNVYVCVKINSGLNIDYSFCLCRRLNGLANNCVHLITIFFLP